MPRIVRVAALAALVLLSACAPTPSGGSAPAATSAAAVPQTLVYGVTSMPATMDPHLNTTGSLRKFEFFETLTRPQAGGGGIEPLLASEWKTVDDSTWRFTIRPGSKFHDGVPVTAADVAFSWDRAQRPDLKSPIPGFIATVASMTAIDANTLEIKTKGPDPLLARRMFYLAVIPKALIERIGEAAWIQKPVGSGPFTLSEYRADDRIVLNAWKEHPFRKPTLETLTVRLVPDAATRLAGLRTGSIDLMQATPLDQVNAVKQEGNTVWVNYVGTFGLILDTWGTDGTDAGPIADTKVRQALNYAVDRDAIASKLWGAVAKPAGYLVPETAEGYSADVKPYTFDTAKAKSILATSGYPNGFKLTIEISPILPEYRTSVLAIQDSFKAIGVEVEAIALDAATSSDRQFKRKPSTAVLAIGILSTPLNDADLPLGSFASNGPIGKRYTNPAYDAKLAESRQQVDPAKRRQLLKEAAQILQDDPPWLGVTTVPSVFSWSKTVKVPQVSSDGPYFEFISRTN